MRIITWVMCSFFVLAIGTTPATEFSSDVPLLQKEQLNPRFWQTKISAGDSLLLTVEQIKQRNQETFALQPELQALDSLPEYYTAAQVRQVLAKVSAIPSSPRFYADGTPLTPQHWQLYQQLLALDTITAQPAVQFGLVVKRTAMRAFPTQDRVFNADANLDLDRFAETALFVAEPVAVLHSSRDNNWLLVQSYHYTGWVQAADVAIGTKQQVLAYAEQQPFVVATGAKVFTAFTPQHAALSELQLDMGVRLPLLSAASVNYMVQGQNTASSYVVQLPVRADSGQLYFMPALIPYSADVNLGYLPFTANNIIGQAFKFLGERYGWGHDYNGRDCTGFISEVFRSFGLLMPRNSTQQGKGDYGHNLRFDSSATTTEKRAALAQAAPGDLLYFPGHVSMYLGTVAQQPFMIHDVNGLFYPKADGSLYQGKLNGVVVTPLLPLNANAEQSYLDVLYAIKSLR